MPWLPQSKVSPVSPLATMSDVPLVVPQVDTSKVTGPLASYESFLRARQQGQQLRAGERLEQRDIAALGQEQAQAERTAALRAATERALPAGATTFDIDAIEAHQKKFGTLPMDPATGRIDLPQVRSNLQTQMQIEQSLQAARVAGLGGVGTAGEIKPDKRLEIEQNQGRLQADMLEADRALAIVNDPNINTVGPGIGSAPGRGWAWAKAFFGAEGTYENQRALEMTMSSNILAKAENMKGQLSDRDVRFLQSSVPKLTDTENTWRDYIGKWKAIIRRQYEKNAAALNGTLSDAERSAAVCDELKFTTGPNQVLTPKTVDEIMGGGGSAGTSTLPADRKPGDFYWSTDAMGRRVVVKIDENGVAVPQQPGQAASGVPTSKAVPANAVSPLPTNTGSGAANILGGTANRLSAEFVKAAVPSPWKTMQDRLVGKGTIVQPATPMRGW